MVRTSLEQNQSMTMSRLSSSYVDLRCLNLTNKSFVVLKTSLSNLDGVTQVPKKCIILFGVQSSWVERLTLCWCLLTPLYSFFSFLQLDFLSHFCHKNPKRKKGKIKILKNQKIIPSMVYQVKTHPILVCGFQGLRLV